MSELDRFSEHVEFVGTHWMWEGAVTPSGHGNVRANGGWMTAQRWAWTLFVGPLDPRDRLRNRCGHRLCVNPEHWEIEE